MELIRQRADAAEPVGRNEVVDAETRRRRFRPGEGWWSELGEERDGTGSTVDCSNSVPTERLKRWDGSGGRGAGGRR